MALFVALWLFMGAALSEVWCNDECCYIYGSIPRNDTNCVPKGEQLSLSCTVYNPHDAFTNLSVVWFKSTTGNMSNNEMISDVQTFTTLSNSMTDLPVENCSRDLYRDNFDIRINHFNTSDSGYYWCQMSINNTYVQPSDHAFFCASTNCHDSDFQRLPYFRLAIQGEHTCARYLKVSSESPSMEVVSTRSLASLSATTLGATLVTKSQPLSRESLAVTTTVGEISRPLITHYVTGSLSALVLLLGALVIVLLMMYLCKFRKRKPREIPFKNTGIQSEIAIDSSRNAQPTVTLQDNACAEDDIYSTVSDDSLERGSSPCSDAQQPHPLPYETAVFHDQNQALPVDPDTQKPHQDMTDSKPSNEVDSKQYRGNQSDEHHVYDEVQHELKEKQNRSSVKVISSVSDHAKRSTEELFDDVMYSPCPPKSAQHPDADITRNQYSGIGITLPQTSTKLTGKWSEYKTPETVTTKELLNRSEEHVYDSVDQANQRPTKPQVIPKHSDSTNGGTNRNQHVYHTLESQESSQDKEVDPKSHTLAANSKFDDPMYESTLIQAQADPQDVATPGAYPMMDEGETEPQENGNPDLVPNYDGNVKDSTAAPQQYDPTNSESMGTAMVQKVLDKQDRGPINSTSDYAVFDDPAYGNCVPHAESDRKIICQ